MFASIQLQFHADVRSYKTEIEIKALGIQALVVGCQLDEMALFGAGILNCPPEQGAPNTAHSYGIGLGVNPISTVEIGVIVDVGRDVAVGVGVKTGLHFWAGAYH